MDRDPDQERDEEQRAGIDAERHDQFIAPVDEYRPFPPDDYGDIGKDAYRRWTRVRGGGDDRR